MLSLVTLRTRLSRRAPALCALGASLLLAVVPAHAADPDAAGPEQAADLYLKALINADPASARQLNERLKPAYGGHDAVDLAALPRMQEKMARKMGDTLVASLPPESRAALRAPLDAMAAQFVAASRRARCHATDSRTAGNPARQGSFVAKVSYVCQLPDIQAALRKAAVDGETKPSDTRQYADMVRRAGAAFAAAPLARRLESSMALYAGPDRRVWMSAHPDAPVRTVFGAMTSDLQKGL